MHPPIHIDIMTGSFIQLYNMSSSLQCSFKKLPYWPMTVSGQRGNRAKKYVNEMTIKNHTCRAVARSRCQNGAENGGSDDHRNE